MVSTPVLFLILDIQMKNYLIFLIAVLFFACDNIEAETEAKEWSLIWSDEFNKDGTPDNSKWSFAGKGTPDWKCYCTDSEETSSVFDGNLVLKGIIKENVGNTVEYQTGCINTKEKFSFKYGKIEVRAKVSEGQGSWPAIWLMPEKSVYGGWPKSGEIDIMEHLNFDSFVYQTVHNEFLLNQGGKSTTLYHAKAALETNDYNVFGMEWYPDRLEFFVNGTKNLTFNKPENANSEKWPYDQEFYIILNQALGGAWVGEINDAHLPQKFSIDWIRVYQKN